MPRIRARWMALIAAVLVLAGCVDQDPFGFSTRKVAGPYRLQQWEDFRTYYLEDGRSETDGPLSGTVARIGWNDRYIVAWMVPSFGGEREGWVIVDAREREVAGRFTDADLARRPEARGVRIMPAAEAWERLPVRPNAFFYFLISALVVGIGAWRRRRSEEREGAAPA